MMHNGYAIGKGSGLFLLWGTHALFMLSLGIGLLFLLLWAFKHLSGKQLWTWGWTLVAIGLVGCLLTILALPFHRYQSKDGFGMMGRRNVPMMWEKRVNADEAEAQTKEESDGKAMYDKLLSKEVSCADLTDADFELMGEYVMGQRLGEEHVQMNERMKLMMGDKGEEQMHIVLGKSLAGCEADLGPLGSSGGMMNRGMMRAASGSTVR